MNDPMEIEFESYYSAQQARLQELRVRIAAEHTPAQAPPSAHLHDNALETTQEPKPGTSTVWRSLNTALASLAEDEARLKWNEQTLLDEEKRLADRRRAAVQRKSILLAKLHTIAAQEESLRSGEDSLKRDEAAEKEESVAATERQCRFEELVQKTQEKLTAKRLRAEKHRTDLAAESERQDEAERLAKASVVALQARIAEIEATVQQKMDALTDRERVVLAAEERQRATLARRMDRIRAALEHHDA